MRSSAGRMSASRRCSTGSSGASWRWSTMSPASPAIAARAKRGLPTSPSPSSTRPVWRKAIPKRSPAACGRRPKPRLPIATRSCLSSTRARALTPPTGISPRPCAAPASRSSSSPTRPRASGATASMKPSASASAIRSPYPPNMARGLANSMTRSSKSSRPPRASSPRRRTKPSRFFSARRRTAASSTSPSRCASPCSGGPTRENRRSSTASSGRTAC